MEIIPNTNKCSDNVCNTNVTPCAIVIFVFSIVVTVSLEKFYYSICSFIVTYLLYTTVLRMKLL